MSRGADLKEMPLPARGAMTWREFKAAVEKAGVTDDAVISFIDVDGWGIDELTATPPDPSRATAWEIHG